MVSNKQQLRAEIRNKRRNLNLDECQVAAVGLFNNILPLVAGVNSLAIYFAVHNEINLTPLIDYCLLNNKKVYAPIAYQSSKILKFEEIAVSRRQDIFVTDDYIPVSTIAANALDMVLVPLLACDYHGNRLGQGGGYYDSTFAALGKRPLLCGVGYDWQLVPELVCDNWDIPLDFFASDRRLLGFRL